MNRTKRLLEDQSAFVKLLVLTIIILSSTLFIFFIGILGATLVYGTNIFDLLSEASNLQNPEGILLLKFFQVVNQIGLFILPSFLFPLLFTRRVAQYLKLKTLPGTIAVISTILLIFSVLPGINWLMQINEAVHLPEWMSGIENWARESEANAARLTEAFVATTSISGLLINLFIIAFLASVGEELLFRGILLQLFGEWLHNSHLAVWITAILFSMFHLQFFGFLPRMALGIIFGYLFVWSGSLWLPILAHFINNGAAVIVYYLHNVGSVDTSVEHFGEAQNNTLLIASILVSAGILTLIYFKGENKLRFTNTKPIDATFVK